MLSFFGVTVVVYFMKILSGYQNYTESNFFDTFVWERFLKYFHVRGLLVYILEFIVKHKLSQPLILICDYQFCAIVASQRRNKVFNFLLLTPLNFLFTIEFSF